MLWYRNWWLYGVYDKRVKMAGTFRLFDLTTRIAKKQEWWTWNMAMALDSYFDSQRGREWRSFGTGIRAKLIRLRVAKIPHFFLLMALQKFRVGHNHYHVRNKGAQMATAKMRMRTSTIVRLGSWEKIGEKLRWELDSFNSTAVQT